MMHRNPSMHCLHPALSLILHQQTVSLFPLFPSCVFIFTFFLFPQLLSLSFFTVFIAFLLSQYYVSFTFVFFLFIPFLSVLSFLCLSSLSLLLVYPFSVSLVFLFSFFSSSLLPQFFFLSFPSYISNFFMYCVCCSSSFFLPFPSFCPPLPNHSFSFLASYPPSSLSPGFLYPSPSSSCLYPPFSLVLLYMMFCH